MEPAKESQQVEEPAGSQLLKPVVVEYCPICTLPFEYCAWTPKAQKCLEWKQKNRPELVTATEEPGVTKEAKEGEQKPAVAAEQPKADEESSKKYIVFDVKERMKKKFITTIWGLQANKIDAKTMSKKCSKKFACSCSVVDEDKIQIQGDISQELFDFMESEFKIKGKYILTAEEWQEKVDKLKKKEEKKKKQKEQKKEADKDKAPEQKEVDKPKEQTPASTAAKEKSTEA